MTSDSGAPRPESHPHVFLGKGHATSERQTWAVIWLCGTMMCAEIIGGFLFGSIAQWRTVCTEHPCRRPASRGPRLHLCAPARRESEPYFWHGEIWRSRRFQQCHCSCDDCTLDRLRIGDSLSGPGPNSLRGGDSYRLCGSRRQHRQRLAVKQRRSSSRPWAWGDSDHDEAHSIATPSGDLILELFEDGVPPRFRLRAAGAPVPAADTTRIATTRPDGTTQEFSMTGRGEFLESVEVIPSPTSLPRLSR